MLSRQWMALCISGRQLTTLSSASFQPFSGHLSGSRRDPRAFPVHPWSDCVVALQQANGAFGALATSRLAGYTRAVFQAVQASGVGLRQVSHVRSHQGHPANECVDGLAKWACCCRLDLGHPYQLPFAAAARNGSLEWWWLVISSVREPACWPRHVGGIFSTLIGMSDASPPTDAESRAWLGLPQDGSHKAQGLGLKICLRAMTVNADAGAGAFL